MQVWAPEEQNQVFKIKAYNPYRQYNQGAEAADMAQQKSTLDLDVVGSKLQGLFPKYAAKAAAAEASLSSLLIKISTRPYHPADELREFAQIPAWLRGADVWKVSRVIPALSAVVPYPPL